MVEPSRVCWGCGKEPPADVTFRRCQRCAELRLPSSYFCGEECMRANWPRHKEYHKEQELKDEKRLADACRQLAGVAWRHTSSQLRFSRDSLKSTPSRDRARPDVRSSMASSLVSVDEANTPPTAAVAEAESTNVPLLRESMVATPLRQSANDELRSIKILVKDVKEALGLTTPISHTVDFLHSAADLLKVPTEGKSIYALALAVSTAVYGDLTGESQPFQTPDAAVRGLRQALLQRSVQTEGH